MGDYLITCERLEPEHILDDRAFDQYILPQIESLHEAIREHGSPPRVSKVAVDLSKVRFANPYGALGIVILCNYLYDQFKRRVDLLLPSDEEGSKFSSWMDSLNFLNSVKNAANIIGCAFSPDASLKPGFIPVISVNTQEDVYKAVGNVQWRIRPILVEKLGYTEKEAYRFATVISELCQNICYHSAPVGAARGYMAMQTYKEGIKFAVMDLGLGIPKTIHAKYQTLDDFEAIKKACEAETTSKERGGLGLYQTVQIVKQASGFLNIRSGHAKAVSAYGKDFVIGGGNDYWAPIYFPGTQIGIHLPRRNFKNGG